MPKLLSRLIYFNAIAGVNTTYKDYLSITKDQGEEGLCWAYSLTSAIEMKYALKTGNRLMLDPLTLYNNSVKWYKKHKKAYKDEIYSNCFDYAELGGYSPFCAIGFLHDSKQEMKYMNGNNSNIYVSDAGLSEIKTVNDLINSLRTHNILYSGINSDVINDNYLTPIFEDYYLLNETNHGVVITAIGTIDSIDGVYIEILNSWGYKVGYDGLFYIKVADSLESELINNMNIFNYNFWLDVDRMNKEDIFIALIIILGVLLLISIFIIIIILGIYKSNRKKKNNDLDNELKVEINEARV